MTAPTERRLSWPIVERRSPCSTAGLLVERVLVEGWTQAAAASATGVSRATVAKWVKRFREEGPPGLEDRASAPHRSPHALPLTAVHRILRACRAANPVTWSRYGSGLYLMSHHVEDRVLPPEEPVPLSSPIGR